MRRTWNEWASGAGSGGSRFKPPVASSASANAAARQNHSNSHKWFVSPELKPGTHRDMKPKDMIERLHDFTNVVQFKPVGGWGP